MSVYYSLFNDNEGSTISVVIDGQAFGATDAHPFWDKILQAVVIDRSQDADTVANLFDLSQQAGQKFQKLSERVTVASGEVRFDGDVIHSSLTDQILRFIEEGVADWQPLVNFFEKVMTNPTEHSREQLFQWIEKQDITLTQDGDMVAYKGVESDHNGGYRSTSAGTAIVDGVVVKGKIPNAIGGVVEMPRSNVTHDPHNACSSGLHIGSFSYAQSYSHGGCMLEVHVNPRDVVSVPNDGQGEKARVCRYVVADIIVAPHASAVLAYQDEESYDPYDEDEYDEDAYYGEDEDDLADLDAGYEDKLDAQGPVYGGWVANTSGSSASPTFYGATSTPSSAASPIPADNVGELDETPASPADVHPTEDEFENMKQRAARRRRNFKKYATKHGPWHLIGSDPDVRTEWSK